jgi:hypothetical protein
VTDRGVLSTVHIKSQSPITEGGVITGIVVKQAIKTGCRITVPLAVTVKGVATDSRVLVTVVTLARAELPSRVLLVCACAGGVTASKTSGMRARRRRRGSKRKIKKL